MFYIFVFTVFSRRNGALVSIRLIHTSFKNVYMYLFFWHNVFQIIQCLKDIKTTNCGILEGKCLGYYYNIQTVFGQMKQYILVIFRGSWLPKIPLQTETLI